MAKEWILKGITYLNKTIKQLQTRQSFRCFQLESSTISANSKYAVLHPNSKRLLKLVQLVFKREISTVKLKT